MEWSNLMTLILREICKIKTNKIKLEKILYIVITLLKNFKGTFQNIYPLKVLNAS